MKGQPIRFLRAEEKEDSQRTEIVKEGLTRI